MKYEQIINRLLAADDLHYDPEKRRFVSLSQEEVERIKTVCLASGITDRATIYKVVQWCGYVRVGELLRNSFLAGRVRICGFDGNQPFFGPLETAP